MRSEEGQAGTRDSRFIAGLTAIGIIVLAAMAYSLRIALDITAGSAMLTMTFLAANVVGWAVGSLLRRSDRSSALGLCLVLLGDAVFPLNLFAPFVLAVPGMRGSAALSATAVVLIGIAYHLWNYRRRSSVRFALWFYPYFFALAGGAVIVLTRFTAGIPMIAVAWMMVAYALSFSEMIGRARPEPALHFCIAGSTSLTCAVGVGAVALSGRDLSAFAAIVAGTVILIAFAVRERADEGAARAYGLGAWLGVTAVLTSLLYLGHSPLWLYAVATGGWIAVLSIVSMIPPRAWTAPFHESAYWAAMLLAAGLAALLWRVWMPFVVRTMGAAPSLRVATAVALAEAGVALFAVSAWRRRYPPIAATMSGFVANNLFLRLASYAAPLFLTVAAAGGWAAAGIHGPANVYALLAAGMLLLMAGPLVERSYPPEALDFAGVLAMVFSAFNALASAELSARVLFAGAAIFLVRYLRGATAWVFWAFLTLTAGGLWLQTIGSAEAAIAFGLAAVAIGWGSAHAETAGKRISARLGYWLSFAASLLLAFSLARTWGFGRAYDALVVAAWAWLPLIVRRLSARWAVAAATSYQASVIGVLAALAMLWLKPEPAHVLVMGLLVAGALLLELKDLHAAGYVVLALSVGMAINRVDPSWLISVMLATAAILLWRSLGRRSSMAHLLFIAAATAAAYLAVARFGAQPALPAALLVALLIAVELVAQWLRSPSPLHADVTPIVAVVLAGVVIGAEIASGRFSPSVSALLLLPILLIRPWIERSDAHRVQPAAHAAFRTVALLAAALLVVAGARAAGLTSTQSLFALSIAMWGVLPLLLRSRRGTAVSRAYAAAMLLIGTGVYGGAYAVRAAGDPFPLLACIAAAGAYFVWRAAWKAPWIEHFGGAGLVVAVCLFGLGQQVPWPEYYLFAASAYLCIVLLRSTARRADNAVAVIAILAAVGWPYVALLRSAQKEHLIFLSLAGVVLIHVLLATRRHALMVVAVCVMLGLGMIFGATTLHNDAMLNLLMAIVGFLVIADLGVLGLRPDRRREVGEIDYDDNRLAR